MTFPVFIKANRLKISVSKEIREVNRLRLQFERSMTSRLIGVFQRVGKEAAKEYVETGEVKNALLPIERRVDAVFRAHYQSVIDTFADRVYSNRKLQSFGQLVQEFYVNQGGTKIRNVSTTTSINILKAILQGDKEGLNPRETAKLIEQRTGGAIGRARANTIARTETHAAASYATHEATRELNLPAQKKRWVSVGDARTRPHHAAANGQEVGMDEPFILRYQGNEIKMMHPHDGSGGAANNINCRCLAVYFSDIDDLFDDETDAINPAFDVPETQVVGFTSPRDTSITSETLPVIGKTNAKRALERALDDAWKDPLNQELWTNLTDNWQGMNIKDFGKAAIGGFNQRAVEMISYIHTVELAKLANRAGVANLRSIVPTRKSGINGSMGGGQMKLSKESIETYVDAAKIRDIDVISAELSAAKRKRWTSEADLDDFLDKHLMNGLSDELEAELNTLRAAFKKDDIAYRTLNAEYQRARDAARKGVGQVATYQIGGDISERPWSTKEYFPDGLDKVRALMYHEFGHHIHQSYRLDSEYSRTGYIELKLQKFWRDTSVSEREHWAPSGYAMHNEYEYFVESLTMYLFDRKDMIHPEMIDLINEVLDVAN